MTSRAHATVSKQHLWMHVTYPRVKTPINSKNSIAMGVRVKCRRSLGKTVMAVWRCSLTAIGPAIWRRESGIRTSEHCLKTWSTNQSSPAFSSCGPECYRVVDGASRALGMQTAAKELVNEVEDWSVEMVTDSSGAKSFTSQRGSGRIRLIEVKCLWLPRLAA